MKSPLPEYSVEDLSEMTMFSPLPNDDEDDELRQQSDSNFSNTNCFQSGGSGQNTEHPHLFETHVPRRCSKGQSPEGINTGSDPSWTSRSSDDNVTYPDLASSLDSPRHSNLDMLQATSPLTLKSQAEIDEEWKLALQLQKEEDYAIEERGRKKQNDYAHENDRRRNAADDARLSFNFAFAPWRASGARQRFSIGFPSPKRTLIPRDTASGLDSSRLGTQANPSNSNNGTLYREFVDTVLNDKTNALLNTLVRQEKEQNQVPTRICVVDGEAYSITSMPTLSACSHDPNYCAECYQRWLTAQLEDSSWHEARCPEHGCNAILTYPEIQQHASQESFELYDKFLTRAALNQDRKYRPH
ncbi:hypothetical protein IAQ61_009764 [Plenodomus lingam]|uniref:uncharacterized protein n=1 Tax=Leptosphaeria maculans TaxID=5022 RepID=UPI00333203B4|nr:hypothetical protein IAQ61_009764 [Plenodomus lingam]